MKKKQPEIPELSEDKLSVEYDENDFEKSLPNLAHELKDKEHWARVPIGKIERDDELDSETSEADDEISEDDAIENEKRSEDDLETEEDLESNETVESEETDDFENLTHPHPKSIVNPNQKSLESSNESDELDTEEIETTQKLKPLTKEEEQELCDPKIENYLCRCKTIDQAEDIIKYCVSKKEITPEKGDEIRNRIKKEGLRSFGEYKAWGHYERKYRRGSKDLDLTERSSE